MDLLKGRPLDRVLEDERALPVDRALAIMEPLARAVACVHEAGIIHRDLKPANVFLDESGGPVLIDFGLARALDDADNLTRTGAAVGTPSYMSPEQVRGIRSEVDERTDVWALGVLLFEMVSGERPFTGDNAPVLYARIQTEDAPPLRQVTSGVSLALEAIVAKALERDRQR